MNNTPPEKILSRLILCDEEGRQGNICSGLVQNFKAGTCQFNVRHADGSVYRVTVKQEEMEPANDDQLLSHDSEKKKGRVKHEAGSD